jgi:hypothetical protein
MKIWRKARGAKASLANHQHSRVFLVKILQHDFLHRRSSRCRNINLQSLTQTQEPIQYEQSELRR